MDCHSNCHPHRWRAAPDAIVGVVAPETAWTSSIAAGRTDPHCQSGPIAQTSACVAVDVVGDEEAGIVWHRATSIPVDREGEILSLKGVRLRGCLISPPVAGRTICGASLRCSSVTGLKARSLLAPCAACSSFLQLGPDLLDTL